MNPLFAQMLPALFGGFLGAMVFMTILHYFGKASVRSGRKRSLRDRGALASQREG